MRILHVANFSWLRTGQPFYAIDNKLNNGLIRNGHYVHPLSYRDFIRASSWIKSTADKLARARLQEHVLSTAREIAPDVIFLGHSELVNHDTLRRLKQEHPNTPISMWWVDWLQNRTFLEERIQYVDAFFATSGKEALKSGFPGYPENRLHFFPNPCDSGIESGKAFEVTTPKHDLIFFGRPAPERKEILNTLHHQKGHTRFAHFGYSPETILSGAAFINEISQSYMGLNYSRNNAVECYTSDRLIQIIGNGALALTPRTPGMERIFETDEVGYFETDDELMEKIDWFMANPEEGRKIAKKAWRKAHTLYSSEKIAEWMISKLTDSAVSAPWE